MFHVEITLTAPTMHALGFESTTAYLVDGYNGLEVVEYPMDATEFAGYLEAADYVEELSQSEVGIEAVRVIEAPKQAIEVGTEVRVLGTRYRGEVRAYREVMGNLYYVVELEDGIRRTLNPDRVEAA